MLVSFSVLTRKCACTSGLLSLAAAYINLGFPLAQSISFLQVGGMSRLCLSDYMLCLCCGAFQGRVPSDSHSVTLLASSLFFITGAVWDFIFMIFL